MIQKKMTDELNKQMNAEFFSAYLYLSMSAYFEGMGLQGFANWMMVQYKEETDHGFKIYYYLLSQGANIKLLPIKEPSDKWESPLHVFKETLKHEISVTSMINSLVDTAEKTKDRATYNFLQWYVAEQVEEEENPRDILNKLKLIGGDANALLTLDKDLGLRQYVPLLPEKSA